MGLRSIAIIALLAGDANAAGPKDEIKLQKIKAADVEKAVAVHKGKVVLLEVWGEF